MASAPVAVILAMPGCHGHAPHVRRAGAAGSKKALGGLRLIDTRFVYWYGHTSLYHTTLDAATAQ